MCQAWPGQTRQKKDTTDSENETRIAGIAAFLRMHMLRRGGESDVRPLLLKLENWRAPSFAFQLAGRPRCVFSTHRC